MNKIERITKIEEELKQLKKEVEIDEKKNKSSKIDFSEFICRWGDTLAIKNDDVMLKSFYSSNISLCYNNTAREDYKDNINYEVIERRELNVGDIYIDDYVSKFEIDDFEIVTKIKTSTILVQYLGDEQGIESTYYDIDSAKVKRFFRE